MITRKIKVWKFFNKIEIFIVFYMFLDFISCAFITNQTLLKIAHSTSKLHNLVLAKCGNIIDERVCHITRKCNKILILVKKFSEPDFSDN